MRYSRQIVLEEFGTKGQELIRKKSVLIVGVGGLGCVCAQLLCRSGIGKLILVDHDKVDITNLHRQLLYTEKDLGKNKVRTAADHLKAINADVEIIAVDAILDMMSVDTIMQTAHFDLLLDCTDNLQTRFLLNRYCIKHKVPWVHASVVKRIGRVKFFAPKEACYACIYGNRKETEQPIVAGVHNTAVFIVGSYQTTLALKALLGKPVDENLVQIDTWNMTIDRIKVKRDPKCESCR
jgi:molybdopterin/thiamine biosynthesis adenylyltransferase